MEGAAIITKGRVSLAGGNEIWITTASGKSDRSISRSTVELGFRKYLEKDITGPRQLGVFGASYLLPLFQRFV